MDSRFHGVVIGGYDGVLVWDIGLATIIMHELELVAFALLNQSVLQDEESCHWTVMLREANW